MPSWNEKCFSYGQRNAQMLVGCVFLPFLNTQSSLLCLNLRCINYYLTFPVLSKTKQKYEFYENENMEVTIEMRCYLLPLT